MENMNIFTDADWNEKATRGEIIHFGYYHRYWLPGHVRNPEAVGDVISKKILDVKDKRKSGITFFVNAIDELIQKDITVCVVPSHERSERNESGISLVARELARRGRIDKVDYLLRTRSIDKLATGGNREKQLHYDTIGVNETMCVSGDVVLLVDDVTTSGASLEACHDILIRHGAETVAMFALGQSI